MRGIGRIRPGLLLFLGFCAVFFFISLVGPTFYIFSESLFPGGKLTAAYYWNLLRDSATREAIGNSFLIGLFTTFVSFLVSLPLALIFTRLRFPGKGLFSGLLLVPMIMPPFVGAVGMIQVFARFGSLNLLLMRIGLISEPLDFLGSGFGGVVILQVLHLFPIMFLNLSAAMANVDPALEEAGKNLGGSGFFLWRKVRLPLLMPGIFAGSTLVFIWAFTDLGTPLILGFNRVVPVMIFNRASDVGQNTEAFALVVLVILLTLGTFLLLRWRMGRHDVAMAAKATQSSREKVPGPLLLLLSYGFVGLLIFAAIVPHIAVILTSFTRQWFMTVFPSETTLDHYRSALSHPLTLGSIRNSLVFSICATGVNVLLGIAIGYVLVRKKFPGKALLEVLSMLPLALPGLVIAFGYLATFTGLSIRWGLAWLDPLRNPSAFLILSYSIRRLPYVVRAAHAGLSQTSVTFEEASTNLGAGPFRTARKIILPLVAANLLAGGILTFTFSMLEVSDSLILATNEEYFPITKAIYNLSNRLEDGPYIASALGVWAMAFLATGLGLAASILKGKMGALFRAQ